MLVINLPKKVNLLLIFILFAFSLAIYFFAGEILTDYNSKITTLDDVSPVTVSPNQLESFLKNHETENLVIFVTPFYHGITNLSSNKQWVEDVVKLQNTYNFSIGLHGYSHGSPGKDCGEFSLPNPVKIKAAREEFKNAFGYYPKIWRAPCFQLNVFDYVYVKILGMKNYGWLNHGNVFHPKDLK